MACCDFFEPTHRDETTGEGEKNYREHVAAHRLSFGEIVVVVVAAVLLAGMGLARQSPVREPATTASISKISSMSLGGTTRCDDDNHYLSQSCEP